MAKMSIDKLEANVKKILQEYVGDVDQDIEKATRAIARKGAQAIQTSAAELFDGETYASGWTSEVQKTRVGVTGVIYNNKQPGLAHLLENGHAAVNGGRVEGRPHIKPVEDAIVKEYEEAIKNAISGA